jgi:lysophospholipase L1-like esterase
MRRRALFWSALPWVIPQALWLRKTAPRFKPASGLTTGVVGDGDTVHLVGIGDSIIAGVGVAQTSEALTAQTAAHLVRFNGGAVRWQTFGLPGADTAQLCEILLPQLPARKVDIFVISIGINDVTSIVRTRTWRNNLNTIFRALIVHSPAARIVIAGLPPLRAFPLLPQPLRWVLALRADIFQQILADVCAQFAGVILAPLNVQPSPEQFAADGYHPSAATYAALGELMARACGKIELRPALDPFF